MRNERGFSIITAIFLITVLATLAVFSISMMRVQSATSAYDIQGARAYQAAQAGIEWGAFQVLRVTPPLCAPGTPNTSSFAALPVGLSSLSAFTITVNCTATEYTEADVTITIYQLTSTACNQPTAAGACAPPVPVPGDGYIERQVRATLER